MNSNQEPPRAEENLLTLTEGEIRRSVRENRIPPEPHPIPTDWMPIITGIISFPAVIILGLMLHAKVYQFFGWEFQESSFFINLLQLAVGIIYLFMLMCFAVAPAVIVADRASSPAARLKRAKKIRDNELKKIRKEEKKSRKRAEEEQRRQEEARRAEALRQEQLERERKEREEQELFDRLVAEKKEKLKEQRSHD
ncbi:hypothetical protein [Candidatus Corynebacterium faecigallinarum]|uniref:hypothetical protein n=1 Tax=Candidatus Corynebacterium faecigallinarum TaxID=2838528 RepID=UPI003FCFDD06